MECALCELFIFCRLATLDAIAERINNAKVCVHRCKVAHAAVADVPCHGAKHCLLGECELVLTEGAFCRVDACKQSAAGRFDVALNTRHLPCKENVGARIHGISIIKKTGRVEIGVAVHNAITQELCVLKSGDHAKYPSLLGESQVRLEADEVEHCSLAVLLAKLDNSVEFFSHAWVDEPYGLERSVAQGVIASLCHDLNGHTALKYLDVLLALFVKLLELCLFGSRKSLPKGVVLFFVHGTVDIVRISLVVTGCEKGNVHIDGGGINDGRGGIKEMQLATAELACDKFRHSIRGQGTCCNNGDNALFERGDLRFNHLDVGVVADAVGDIL